MEEDKRRFGRWDIETRLETVQGNSHHFEYQRYGSSEESGWLELEMKSSLRSAMNILLIIFKLIRRMETLELF